MFKRTKVCAALTMALGANMLTGISTVQAQQELERVEITGSSIRRIQGETALPVQVIKREDIERSGATSIAELVQQIPAMQYFTNEGASVGGGGNGFAGASIHNLEETRTLVLLNGRRLAQFAGQSIGGALAGVDLNMIPLSSIERVEILTDGASALYGADAIGGVVNFITKKNLTGGDIVVGASNPGGGAKERRLSLSMGGGDFERDGYNLMVGANYETRSKLASTAREFSKTGVINFNLNGNNVSFFNGSPRGIPANVTHDNGTPANGNDDYLVSPYYLANGQCPPGHVALLEGPTTPACYYDYVTQLEIFPERERETFLGQGSVKLGEDHKLYGEFLYASTSNTNRLAPPPGEVLVGPTSPYWPSVLSVNPAATTDTVIPYRLADVGKRTSIDKTDAQHYVIGVDGTAFGWDYDTSFTHSVNKQETSLDGGWVKLSSILNALNSGLINPFVPPGNQSPAAQQALDNAKILGFWEGGEFTLDALQLRGSGELIQLPGGKLSMGTGVSYMREKFEKGASDIAQGIGDTRFGDDAAIIPYTATRNAAGVFGELIAPFSKSLEMTASMRHDRYSDFGGSTTAKLSARFQPAASFLLRGSIGTGFKAPTVPQISATKQQFGVTAGNYTCSPALAAIATGLGGVCPTGNVQYNVYAEGNPNLEPEKSNQWTLGFRLEPGSWLSVGADIWQVKLRNKIGQVDEATVFADPNSWQRYFTTYTDPGTNQVLLALYQPNDNLGNNTQRGIDFDTRIRLSTGAGRLTTQLALTYWLKDSYQLIKGGPYLTSLGQYGANGEVTFRWQGKLSTTLEHGSFAHTLGFNFKSGYKDQPYAASDFAVFDPATFTPYDYNGEVKRHYTLDWQTQFKMSKAGSLTLGMLNVTNKSPPRSLKSSGGGQQIGYDDRYYDPRGRTVYANASLKF